MFCKNCANEISNEALACPKCGQPTVTAKIIAKSTIICSYILSVLIPFVGFFCGIYLLCKKSFGHGIANIAISIAFFFINLSIISALN